MRALFCSVLLLLAACAAPPRGLRQETLGNSTSPGELLLIDGMSSSLDALTVDRLQKLGLLTTPLLLWATSAPLGTVAMAAFLTLAGILNATLTKLATDAFPATCLLMIVHMLTSDVLMLALKWREISVPRAWDVLRWMPVPFLYVGILSSWLWAYKETTFSTVLILKSIIPLVSFGAEKLLFGVPEKVTASMVASLLMSLLGTGIYGWWNVSATHRSVLLVMCSCTLLVVDRLLQRHLLTSDDFGMSLPMCILVNNTVGLVPMLGLALLTGEVWEWKRVSAGSGAWIAVLVTGVLGTCCAFIGLKFQRLVTATMQLVLQNLAKLLSLAVGLCVFKDDVAGWSRFGCAMALAGSVWYGFLQLGKRTKWTWRGQKKTLL